MNKRHQWLWVVVLVAVVVLAAVFGLRSRQHEKTKTPASASARDTYANLYQAAWRQDSGQGNILVTSTLMLPTMITLLGQDTERSQAEDQLYQASHDMTDHQIGILVTFDSVNGPIADDAITSGAKLVGDSTQFSDPTWHPFIAPSHVVNTNQSTSFQSGLLVFRSSSSIDWPKLKNIKLTISGIDSQPERNFVWADPQILLQSQ